MTKTVILSPRFSSDSQDLWRAANKCSEMWNIHRAINHMPPDPKHDCCVYGELTFCDIMAERCQLSLLDPSNNFLYYLPKRFTKRDIYCCEKDDFEYYFNIYKSKVFVKPANDKVFQYGVYHKASDVPLKYLSDDCPILLSNVVEWETEVRLYCLDGKVSTAASYRYIGDLPEEQELKEATEFGESVLSYCSFATNRLPSAVVLDVGRITGEGWAVVEANQAYASGIYEGADPEKILEIIYRSAGKRDRLSEYDRQFVRNK